MTTRSPTKYISFLRRVRAIVPRSALRYDATLARDIDDAIADSEPTSGNDEVEAMCKRLKPLFSGAGDVNRLAYEAAALIRKQAAELDFWQREGIGDQLTINGLKAQIAEQAADLAAHEKVHAELQEIGSDLRAQIAELQALLKSACDKGQELIDEIAAYEKAR